MPVADVIFLIVEFLSRDRNSVAYAGINYRSTAVLGKGGCANPGTVGGVRTLVGGGGAPITFARWRRQRVSYQQ